MNTNYTLVDTNGQHKTVDLPQLEAWDADYLYSLIGTKWIDAAYQCHNTHGYAKYMVYVPLLRQDDVIRNRVYELFGLNEVTGVLDAALLQCASIALCNETFPLYEYLNAPE